MAFTIIEAFFPYSDQWESTLTEALDHSTTAAHTVLTSSQAVIIVLSLYAGSIACHNKSLAALENHPKKHIANTENVNRYFIFSLI
ncbi:hypothetical protein IKI14_02555 [bacterium]|nr:hypothetical protein [bacterium]